MNNANVGLLAGFCCSALSLLCLGQAERFEYVVLYALSSVLGGFVMLMAHMSGDR